MTTGNRHPRSNKKEAALLAPPARAACLRASCSLQWPRAPAPHPARKCEAARGTAHAPPRSASAQNFESAHVKLSLPFQRGTELWGTLGSDGCGGWARPVSFFSSTFSPPCRQSRVLAPLLPPSPSEPAGPPPRLSPTCVRYLLEGGDRRGCPVFSRGTARRGNFDIGKNDNKYLNTDPRIRRWDTHLNFRIPRRSGRQEVSAPSFDPRPGARPLGFRLKGPVNSTGESARGAGDRGRGRQGPRRHQGPCGRSEAECRTPEGPGRSGFGVAFLPLAGASEPVQSPAPLPTCTPPCLAGTRSGSPLHPG